MREFHLGDILSITMGRLVSPRHIDGVYDILNYMTGDNLFTHQLGRASEQCRPYLCAQYPQFDPAENPELQFAIGELILMLAAVEKWPNPQDADKSDVVGGWLSKLTAQYGEMHPVLILPEGMYVGKDPIEELAERIPAERIIPVVVR